MLLAGAYNRINGSYACENPLTMMTMLKGRYNFSGFVVSDWGATHSTNGSLINGLDIEMPQGKYYTEETLQASTDAADADAPKGCVERVVGRQAKPRAGTRERATPR